jgi:oligopeptide/dipeptide ABC transporter ATP-binding protein
VPDPKARRELARLEGEVASAIDTPSGCYFHPRCPERMGRCEREYPALLAQPDGRRVACHLHGGGAEEERAG